MKACALALCVALYVCVCALGCNALSLSLSLSLPLSLSLCLSLSLIGDHQRCVASLCACALSRALSLSLSQSRTAERRGGERWGEVGHTEVTRRVVVFNLFSFCQGRAVPRRGHVPLPSRPGRRVPCLLGVGSGLLAPSSSSISTLIYLYLLFIYFFLDPREKGT